MLTIIVNSTSSSSTKITNAEIEKVLSQLGTLGKYFVAKNKAEPELGFEQLVKKVANDTQLFFHTINHGNSYEDLKKIMEATQEQYGSLSEEDRKTYKFESKFTPKNQT